MKSIVSGTHKADRYLLSFYTFNNTQFSYPFPNEQLEAFYNSFEEFRRYSDLQTTYKDIAMTLANETTLCLCIACKI